MTKTLNRLANAGILTREQLATELGVTRDTLLNWEDNENFPHRKVGRTTLYDIDAIKTWIATGNK